MNNTVYTTKLGSGQGIIQETLALLDLWEEGMDAASLYRLALSSGRFQRLTARRLRNLILEGFAPRFLYPKEVPAAYLKRLKESLSGQELSQLLFLYTCRANKILSDFVVEVYWGAYSSGQTTLTNEDSARFVVRANQSGKTSSPWSENMIERVSRYLTGTLADFGLLEDGRKSVRRFLPFQIEPRVAAYLAYDLHFSGYGDDGLLGHVDWSLFGMERGDALDELRRLTLQGWMIVQSAGGVTRIAWRYQSREELIGVFVAGRL